MYILSKLGKGVSQSKVSKQGSFSKQKVNYWAKRFLKLKLIELEMDGWIKSYRFTAVGQVFFTRGEESGFVPCVSEDYPIKYPLIRDNSSIVWEKLGDTKNWKKLGVMIGDVRVEKTTKHIIVHTGQIIGVNPDHAKIEAGSLQRAVLDTLKSLGVVVEPVGLPLRPWITKFFTKDAEILYELFGVVSTEDGSIDASPPDRIPHEELRENAAAAKLRMPLRVARMESDIRGIKADVATMTERFLPALEDLTKAVKTMTELRNPEPKQTLRKEPDKSGMVV